MDNDEGFEVIDTYEMDGCIIYYDEEGNQHVELVEDDSTF